MPTFSVEQKSKHSPEESFKLIRKYFEEGDDIKKIDSNVHFKFDEPSLSGTAKGSKFECKLKVLSHDGAVVKLEISIPLLLSPFKGKIQETLERKLQKLFA